MYSRRIGNAENRNTFERLERFEHLDDQFDDHGGIIPMDISEEDNSYIKYSETNTCSKRCENDVRDDEDEEDISCIDPPEIINGRKILRAKRKGHTKYQGENQGFTAQQQYGYSPSFTSNEQIQHITHTTHTTHTPYHNMYTYNSPQSPPNNHEEFSLLDQWVVDNS